jgi:hypothetical protein
LSFSTTRTLKTCLKGWLPHRRATAAAGAIALAVGLAASNAHLATASGGRTQTSPEAHGLMASARAADITKDGVNTATVGRTRTSTSPAHVANVVNVVNVANVATSNGTPTPTSLAARNLLVGARSADISFATMNSQIGPVKVTRVFYSGALPAKFAQGNIGSGVKIIVSYKTPSSNTALYVKSIPAGVNVEMVFHHEPEADYGSTPAVAGATFVKAFDAEATVIHVANPNMRVAFIGGAYQYRGQPGGSMGLGGDFIPDKADDFYLDSYQRATIVPAQDDPGVQNFIHELTNKGHLFDGFTEYGRGVIASGATFNTAVATARANVISVDAKYLATLPGVDVWAYWFTTDKASGDQWRFTDAASISAWSVVENANG